MKNQFLAVLFFAFALIFSACVTKKKLQTQDELIQRIIDLEQELINLNQSVRKGEIMLELAEAYEEYAIKKPNASDTVDKLFKAAQNYGSIGEFLKATTILESIIESHPKTDFAKDAMFHVAYLYSVMAQYDKEQSETYNNKSRKYYKMLIKEFPNDSMAEQAKALLSFIGKSDEELLEEIIKKNK